MNCNHSPLSSAVITKAGDDSTSVDFYATAESHAEVTGFGATWVQVVAAGIERGFTHVTIRAEADSSATADTVIDAQTTAGVSVIGKRIPMSTPIVIIVAVE